MKRLLFLFALVSICCSIFAADEVIVENFSGASTGGVQGTRTSFDGRYSQWFYRNARSKNSDQLKDGTRAFWLSRTAGNSCYLESTIEGGIKAVSFNWKQFGTGDNGFNFVMNVCINNEVKQLVSFVGADDYVNTDQTFSEALEIKKNAKLTIQNSSTQSDGTKGGRLLVGPITITPYLFYKQKEVTIGVQQLGYINAELIDNTNGGDIVYSSSDVNVATVSADGVISPVAVGATTITATWEDVSTTYTLNVVDNVIVENFSKVKQTKQVVDETTWDGDLFEWKGNYIRRGVDDTIGLTPRVQATAMRYNAGGPAYLYSSQLVEGGIKHVSFDWRQWGAASNPLTMELYCSVDASDWGMAVVSQEQPAATAATPYVLDSEVASKGNTYLKIQYTSGGAHAVVGAIHITPYLLYADKTAKFMRVNKTYTNMSLINNTAGETGTLSYESSNESVATVSDNGEVTALSAGRTTITAKYTWSATEYVTTSYKIEVYPVACETFSVAETDATYATAGEVSVQGDKCLWHTLLGGVKTSEFKPYVAIIRAVKDDEDMQSYLYSDPIAGGVASLSFDWNLVAEEEGTNWDIRIFINGRMVKQLTDADITVKNQMSEFENLTITGIDEPGNFVIRFENHSTRTGAYSGNTNKGRFVIDNIAWEPYAGRKTIAETVDNSAWLAANDGAVGDVTVERSALIGGVWNTLCMPFALSQSVDLEGAEVQEMVSAEMMGNVLVVGFAPLTGDELVAGKPYLVKPSADLDLSGEYTDVTITNTITPIQEGIVTLTGVFSPFEMTAGDQTTLFVGMPDANGDNLFYPGVTGAMKGMRAYFKLSIGQGQKAPARARFVVNQQTVETGVDHAYDAHVQVTKQLQNGQLIIVREGVKYNTLGQIIDK